MCACDSASGVVVLGMHRSYRMGTSQLYLVSYLKDISLYRALAMPSLNVLSTWRPTEITSSGIESWSCRSRHLASDRNHIFWYRVLVTPSPHLASDQNHVSSY